MQREHGDHYERVTKQVNRIRRLYSRIGEPLPADIIIDLHLHLAPILEEVKKSPKRKGKRRLEA